MNTFLTKQNISFSFSNIYVGHDLLKSSLLVDLSKEWNLKTVIIADNAVVDLFAFPLAKKLESEIIVIQGGERSKDQETKNFIEKKLFELGCGRDTLIIAMGGGVTTDLVGFVASTYLRGVPLILIPTTLLAMVDAAIGGKTAINTSYGKNLLGTFYHPKAILIDPIVLSSLPEKEWLYGLSEMLKMGLIADAPLWKLVESNLKKSEVVFNDLTLISRAAADKARIVEEDPLDDGLRKVLNFGHTIGHAIEALSEYKTPHGLAVALGCVAESHLSMKLGYLSPDEFEKIYKLYSNFPLSLPENYTRESLFKALSHDKKKAQNSLRFVLIDSIGHALDFNGSYCASVSKKELTPTLQWMELEYGKL